MEAFTENEPFVVSEILEIGFDESFPPETFVFEPPEGETIRTQEEAWGSEHESRAMTVEEVAARASFPVWIPASLPEIEHPRILGSGWELHVDHERARERPPIPEFVSLSYWHESGASVSLHEQRAAHAHSERGGEELALDGERYTIWAPEEKRLPLPITIETTRDETHIQLSSQELTREQLVDVARSLVRATTEPPPLA